MFSDIITRDPRLFDGNVDAKDDAHLHDHFGHILIHHYFRLLADSIIAQSTRKADYVLFADVSLELHDDGGGDSNPV